MSEIEIPPTARPHQPSTVLVTLNRAGSKVASRLVAAIHQAAGMPHLDIAKASRRFGERPGSFSVAHRELLDLPGLYVGALRGPVSEMGSFAKNRVVVHVRDPRDVLVSSYFSTAYSHPPPASEDGLARFHARRQQALAMTIDAYCLQKAEWVLSSYDTLHAILAQHPAALRSRYEDMVTHPHAWGRRIARFADVAWTPELQQSFRRLREPASRRPPGRHRRPRPQA